MLKEIKIAIIETIKEIHTRLKTKLIKIKKTLITMIFEG